MRLLLAALLLVLSGCDTSEPPAFVLEAVADGQTAEAVEVEAGDALARVPTAEAAFDPFRDPPSDPDLEERYRLSRLTADALSLATGDKYVVGYYRFRSVERPTGLAPAACEPIGCLVLVLDDSRFENDGAVFFPILEDAEIGPLLRLRPFGFDGQNEIILEGASASRAVAVPNIGEPTVVLGGDTDEVRIARERSVLEVVIVVRHGANARTRVLEAGRSSIEIEVPDGDGPVAVYVLEAGPVEVYLLDASES